MSSHLPIGTGKDNAIIRAYRKIPFSGVHPIPTELQRIIDESDKPKRGRKRKAKDATSESIKFPKRAKKPVQIPRSPSLIIQEESEEKTVTEVQEDNTLRNEEDDTTETSEPATTENIPKEVDYGSGGWVGPVYSLGVDRYVRRGLLCTVGWACYVSWARPVNSWIGPVT
ncbi:unnamed protein product [Lactuca saligna]|uniref:Uncharacterized protein n=1 Tax=Lactuca saligna TaxID=75948 RepID=A0AA35W0M3_LACSI|nr:unnamed protein product [Lactuca saligna]